MHDPRLLKPSSKVIRNESLKDHVCPGCQTKESQLLIVGSYAELMGAPLFPTDKTAQIHCNHCGQTTFEQDLNAYMTNETAALKKITRYPLHWYGALWALLALIVYVTIMSFRAD